MFWVSLMAALATLAAVVAVTNSIRANRRAERAEARQQTIDEENIRRRDEDLRIERARTQADLEKHEYWLTTRTNCVRQIWKRKCLQHVTDQIARVLREAL